MDYYKNSIFPKLSLKDNLTITSLGRLTTRTAIHSKLEKAVVKDLLARLDRVYILREGKVIDMRTTP